MSLSVKVSCHCETSAHTGRGNPPVRGEMYRKAPRKWELLRFLAVIVTWFFSTGGLPHQCAHLLSNDSKERTNTNLSLSSGRFSSYRFFRGISSPAGITLSRKIPGRAFSIGRRARGLRVHGIIRQGSSAGVLVIPEDPEALYVFPVWGTA